MTGAQIYLTDKDATQPLECFQDLRVIEFGSWLGARQLGLFLRIIAPKRARSNPARGFGSRFSSIGARR